MFSFLKKLFGGGNQEKVLELLGQHASILDVRTVGEFKQGHVNGSVNIPLDKLHGQLSKLKKQNKPIVACCATGRRSGLAADMLRQVGLDAVNAGGWKTLERMIKQNQPTSTSANT